MSRQEALAVGYGMTPRGEVGLIIAQAAFLAGVFGTNLFSIIVIALIVVSILPVPFLKHYLVRIKGARQAEVKPSP